MEIVVIILLVAVIPNYQLGIINYQLGEDGFEHQADTLYLFQMPPWLLKSV